MDGFIELYTVHRKLTDEFYQESGMQKLSIDTGQRNWDHHISDVMSFVGPLVGLQPEE